MLNRYLVFTGLLPLLLAVGCGQSPKATAEVTPELEEQIRAHDADVASAERAQK